MPNMSIIRAYRSFGVAVGRTLNGLVATATTCTPVLPAAAATARRRLSSSAAQRRDIGGRRRADLGLLHLEFLLDLMVGAGAEPFLRGLQHGVTRRCRTAVDRIDQHQLFFHPNGAQSPPAIVCAIAVTRFVQQGMLVTCEQREYDAAEAGESMAAANELGSGPDGEFVRDARYLTTRITRDGRDGYPVEPGRYRLVVARACPWANRATIVRRLLGLEDVHLAGCLRPDP